MSTATKTAIPSSLDVRVSMRILEEGYGPGAWHGNDIKAALDDVSAAAAFWRPAPGRHSIAEIAVHHAFTVHAALGRMSAAAIPPFPLQGDDWFALESDGSLKWPAIKTLVKTWHDALAAFVADAAAGRASVKLSDNERFELVLGVACHSAYHAGQVQLVKALHQ